MNKNNFYYCQVNYMIDDMIKEIEGHKKICLSYDDWNEENETDYKECLEFLYKSMKELNNY